MPSRFAGVVRSRVAGQAAAFTVGDTASSLLGGISAAVLARHLSTRAYGSYSFAVALLLFVGMFFEFGLFLPGARMAATSEPAEQRGIVGATLLLYVPVGLAFCAAVFGLSFAVDHWFNMRVGGALRALAPFAFVWPFGFVGLQLAQGTDRLAKYSLANAAARIAFISAAVGLIALDLLTVRMALLVHSMALLIAWAGLAAWLRPSWAGARARMALLAGEARRYGLQVYLGRVLSMGTYNLDVLMVAALTDPRSVGFYALAVAISYPVGLPAAGLANALFPRLTSAARLERSWLLGASALGLAMATAACLLAPVAIRVVLTPDYLPVAALLPPLALAQAIRGVTGLYNSFLTAQARGRELRNTAMLLTAVNVVGNVTLIPPFGAAGAAWASLAAIVANLLAHQLAYRRVVRRPDQAGAA